MPEPERKKEQRAMTYQVGWKKGKIALGEQASCSSSASLSPGDSSASQAEQRIRKLWQAAPPWPSGMLLPLLYALPVFLFAITIALIFGLRF